MSHPALQLVLDNDGLGKLAEAVRQPHPRWTAGSPKKGGILPQYRPYPHQAKALKKAWDNDGRLILAHGTGLGKSFEAVAFAEDVLKKKGGPVVVVVPDGLKTQFDEQGVEKFTNRDGYVIQTGKDVKFLQKMHERKQTPDYIILGWSMLRRHADALRAVNPSLVIADEAHRMKDPESQNYQSFTSLRNGVPHCLLLTGSVVSNTPNDLLPLLSVVSGGEIPPKAHLTSRVTEPVGMFEGLLGRQKEQRFVTRPEEIMALGEKWIDFVSTDDLAKSLPPTTTEYVPVEMSDKQWAHYESTLEGVPSTILERLIRGIVPPKRERAHVFTRVTKARQAAQTTQGKYGLTDRMVDTSPKLRQIVRDAESHLESDQRNKTVVYSNFIHGGVEALHYALQKKGIPHSIFVGTGREIGNVDINKEGRQQAVKDFKDGKTRVLLISGAGAEGLDLKNANMFQAMEGHFNPEVIRQAQARVRRLKGQTQFAPEDRRVVVKRYVSVEPHPGFLKKAYRRIKGEPVKQHTTDEWVYNVARAKHKTNEGVRISLSGAHPLQKGEDPNPERWLLSKPHAYLRRWRDLRTGKYRYEYPKEL